MRTLTAGLTAAQQAASGTPQVAVTLDGVDYTSRVLELSHTEKPYGGIATILLNNADQTLSSLDFRGDKVVITYGFSGETGSAAAPLWVFSQKTVSYEGKLATEISCMDIWLKMSINKLFTGGGVQLTGTITGDFYPGEVVTGGTSGNKGTVVYVDIASGYILITATTGTFTTETVTGANSGGSVVVSAVTNVGGGASAGWYGGSTIYEILTAITTGIVTLEKDSTDSIIDVATYNPVFEISMGTTVLSVFQDLMSLTKCAARAEADEKIHIFDITSAPSADYTYALAGHTFFQDVRDISEVLPNTVYCYWAEPGSAAYASYSGSAVDATAAARFDTVSDIFSWRVSSNDQAAGAAAAKLAQYQREALQGTVVVPMNCGQELFDYITVTDTRANISFSGWVGSLTRSYAAGVYILTIGLGGLQSAESLPTPPVPDTIHPPIVPPVSEYKYSLPLFDVIEHLEDTPAFLPVRIDDSFYATDYNTVGWYGTDTSSSYGHIYAANGTTFTHVAGTLELANTSPYYIYYDSAHASPTILKTTQTFTDTIGAEKILLAIAKQPSISTEDALLVTAVGGKVVEIFATNLSAFSADLGLITAGELRIGTFESGHSNDFKYFTGFRMWMDSGIGRLAGYDYTDGSDEHIHWYTGSDGKMYAGSGAIVMTEDGLSIIGSTLFFYYGSPATIRGYVAGADGSLEIWATTDNDLNISSSENIEISSNKASGSIDIAADASGCQLVLESVGALNIWALGIPGTSTSDIDIYASGGIDFEAADPSGVIDIDAGNDITIDSGDDLYLRAGQADTEDVHILGHQVRLTAHDDSEIWGT